MKQITKFGMLFAAGALLASCSNDNLDNPGEGNVTNPGTVSYMNLSIALAGNQAGTRAGYADDSDAGMYDIGTEEEYSVNSLNVYIFKGSEESNASYAAKGTWGETITVTPADKNDNHLSNKEAINLDNFKIEGLDFKTGDTCWALIVINANADFIEPKLGDTFTSWSQTAQTSNMLLSVTSGSDDAKNYITMTNASGFANGIISSTNIPVTLVKIEDNNLSKEEFESSEIASHRTEIFVQRNVAKVTVDTKQGYSANSDATVKVGDYSAIVDFKGWLLDITNKTSYPVMNIKDFATAYFGTSIADFGRLHSSNTTYDRLFWAIDPNYDKAITTPEQIAAAFDTIVQTSTTSWATSGKSAYCLENTFDVAHMLQGQTTRVVIKASWTPTEDGKDNYFNNGYFRIGRQNEIWNDENLIAEVKARTIQVLDLKTEEEQGKITVALKSGIGAGYYSIKTLFDIMNDGNAVSDENLAKIAGYFNLSSATDNTIAYYKNNEVYYVVRLRHFNDTETDIENYEGEWEPGDTYPTNAEKNFLGRYGLVRNNSYLLTIDGITGLGSPIIPDIKPGDPDDEDEDDGSRYINCSINILAWAKRSQNVTLK